MRNMYKIIFVIVIVAFAASGLYYYLGQQSAQKSSHSQPKAQNSGNTASKCTTVTQSTTAGPYFIRDTARLMDSNLNYKNYKGTRIKVDGFVYAGSDKTVPIQDAKIELWQTDDEGKYHPSASGSASAYREDEIGLRGYVLSDSNGYYSFTSIYPGYYEGRARHIHARISAEGHKEVITQILFEPKSGDGLDLKSDSVAQSLPDCHLLKMTSTNGLEYGTIDFRLGK